MAHANFKKGPIRPPWQVCVLLWRAGNRTQLRKHKSQGLLHCERGRGLLEHTLRVLCPRAAYVCSTSNLQRSRRGLVALRTSGASHCRWIRIVCLRRAPPLGNQQRAWAHRAVGGGPSVAHLGGFLPGLLKNYQIQKSLGNLMPKRYLHGLITWNVMQRNAWTAAATGPSRRLLASATGHKARTQRPRAQK